MASVIKKHYADISLGQLHYRSCGDSGQPTLVLLHQTPSSSVMFEALMMQLADDYYCLAPDFPGFGGSCPLTGDVTIAAYGDALREWLDILNVSGVLLFGHHTGASVGVQMAHDQPALVNAIAMSGPTLLSQQLKEILPTKSFAFDVQKDGSHLMQMWDRISAKDTDASLSLVQRETLLGVALGASYPDAYNAVIAQDFESQLKELTCPILVFAGTEDPLFGQLDAAYACLQNGRKEIIEGGRTYVCERNAAEVATLVNEFYKTV